MSFRYLLAWNEFFRDQVVVPVLSQISQSVAELSADVGWVIAVFLLEHSAFEHRFVSITQCLAADLYALQNFVLEFSQVHGFLVLNKRFDNCFGNSPSLDAVGEDYLAEGIEVNDLICAHLSVDSGEEPDPTSLSFVVVVLGGYSSNFSSWHL